MRPEDQPGRWTRPGRVAGLIVVFASIVGGAGLGARAWADMRDDTSRTIVAVRDTHRDIDRARNDLATATVRLEAERAMLDGELATLAARQKARAAAEDTLATTERQLAVIEAQLAAATADLAERRVRLDVFERCLAGVAKALNQAAVSDTDGLAATLAGVEGTCTEAGAPL